jgi:hypothetical protein
MRDGAYLTAPLSVTTRDQLENRLEVLRNAARAASGEQIAHEVTKLMTSYPSLRGSSDSDAAAIIGQYSEALAGVPLWALRDACKAIARGAVAGLNPDFPPSSARLRGVADGYVSALHLEARGILEVLEAQVALPDNDEMARKTAKLIGTGLRKLSQRLEGTGTGEAS